jgi:hypothetical protein
MAFSQTDEQRHLTQEWVADMRSGKFLQSTGYLHTSRGYCCLGVAAETAIRCGVTIEVAKVVLDADKATFMWNYDGHGSYWTHDVAAKFGLLQGNSTFADPVIDYLPCDGSCGPEHWTGVGHKYRGDAVCCLNTVGCYSRPDPVRAGMYCHPVTASEANDDKNWTLNQIADSVERLYLLSTPEQVRAEASAAGAVHFDLETGLPLREELEL